MGSSIPRKIFGREKLAKLRSLFRKHRAIQLVYLFGSRATGKSGPGSDYDFAVYVNPLKLTDSFDLLLSLMGQIPLILKTDKVDVVVLNDLDSILLKHNIVQDGEVLYEIPNVRLTVELAIIGEYRDFRIMEQQYYKD
jgi:predicted nucleotidyltransferase